MPTFVDTLIILFISIVVYGATNVPRLGERFGRALYQRRIARKK